MTKQTHLILFIVFIAVNGSLSAMEYPCPALPKESVRPSSPEEEFFNQLLGVIKDKFSFMRVSKSTPFPFGITDLSFKGELKHLRLRLRREAISQAEFEEEINQRIGLVLDATEQYLKQRALDFKKLIKEAKRNSRIIGEAPFPENYDGDVQHDRAEPVKASLRLLEPIDLAALRDRHTRGRTSPAILAAIADSEHRIFELMTANDNLARNINGRTVFSPEPVKILSLNPGTPPSGMKWPKEKASPEFQRQHSELFGTDKFEEIGSPSRGQGHIPAAVMQVIRQDAQYHLNPVSKTPLTRDDIQYANLKLTDEQTNRVISHSQRLLRQYGNSHRQKLVNELCRLLNGSSLKKMRLSAEEIDRHIDELLARVERAADAKAAKQSPPQSGWFNFWPFI
jgi:hypothetical protein